ncbi:MAG: tyrosine-type recombinase/integrase [Halomonadaceae bacterium]|nr:tyrosine-type recombinase/integrase [Halomonadaceae bacterium]
MKNQIARNSDKPLRPLKEGRRLPELALGRAGRLRADGEPIIDARNDLEAVTFWLMERAGSSQGTKDSYFLHVERLLLWAAEVKGKNLSDLSVNDMSDYRNFLANPQPRDVWCGPRAPRGSDRWRPFRGPLSPASQALSMNVISSLMGFLCAAGYLRANPMLLLRRPRAQRGLQQQTIERFLDEGLLAEIASTLDQMPVKNAAQQGEAERDRWVFVLLTTMGLRRDEVVSHTHGAFERRYRPNGTQWWCHILGKGNKLRVIPVPRTCIAALVRYRKSLGLEGLPPRGDETPMVKKLRGKGGVSDTTLYRIVKALFERTAQRIAADNPDGAERLRQASPHWLRHTQITSQGNLGVNMKHRNKSAGHASIETTARYDHAIDDEWHQDMQRTPLDEWVGEPSDDAVLPSQQYG